MVTESQILGPMYYGELFLPHRSYNLHAANLVHPSLLLILMSSKTKIQELARLAALQGIFAPVSHTLDTDYGI